MSSIASLACVLAEPTAGNYTNPSAPACVTLARAFVICMCMHRACVNTELSVASFVVVPWKATRLTPLVAKAASAPDRRF